MEESATAIITNDSSNSTAMPDYCTFEPPPLTAIRFWIVTVLGSCVSLCSILENSFFFYVFVSRKHHRQSYNLYMLLLCVLDVAVSAAYLLLMSTNILTDYLESPSLARVWFSYMVPVLTISHSGITSSCFLIVAATFERCCLTLNSKHVRFVQRNRKWIVLGAIVLGVISKGTIALEFKITYVEECAGEITETRLEFASFVHQTNYNIFWRFWYRNIITIFLPFAALLAMNIQIVRALSRAEKNSYCESGENSLIDRKRTKRKKIARSATRTTVLVVCTYLISNFINVAITTWEHIDINSLLNDHIQLYAIALDLASLLTNLACALRPVIYLTCQAALRKEVAAILKGLCSRGEKGEGSGSGGANPSRLPNNCHLLSEVIFRKMDPTLTMLVPYAHHHRERSRRRSSLANFASQISSALGGGGGGSVISGGGVKRPLEPNEPILDGDEEEGGSSPLAAAINGINGRLVSIVPPTPVGGREPVILRAISVNVDNQVRVGVAQRRLSSAFTAGSIGGSGRSSYSGSSHTNGGDCSPKRSQSDKRASLSPTSLRNQQRPVMAVKPSISPTRGDGSAPSNTTSSRTSPVSVGSQRSRTDSLQLLKRIFSANDKETLL